MVASGVVVELASGHQTTSLAHPTHTATARPVPTAVLPALASGFPESLDAASLPFVSLAQVQEAANAEYRTDFEAVLFGAGGTGVGGATGSRSAGKVVEAFRQDGPSGGLVIQLTVASPGEARREYGEAVAKGPCAGPIPNRAPASSCASASVPGGGTLWTWEVTRAHSPPSGT